MRVISWLSTPSILGTTGMDKGLSSQQRHRRGFRYCNFPLALWPNFRCTGAEKEYGVKCIFAFTLVQEWVFLASSNDGDVCRRGDIYPDHFPEHPEIILNSIPMNLRYAISAGDR